MEEEKKKKTYSPLPSNYITLAQLQERWLKQHNKPLPPSMHPQHLPPTNATASTSPHRNHSLINNPNDSGTRRREIDVTSADNRRKSDAVTGTGDGGADPNGKARKSKKMWGKKRVEQKPKAEEVEEKRANEEGARGNAEAEKTTTKNEVNEEKNIVEKVEQRVRVLSINPGNGEQNERLRKINNGFRYSQYQRNYRDGYGYGYGQNSRARYGYGQNSRVWGQKSEKKMVWVRKDGNGDIET
ncbi:hypothetical protein RJT34_08489 [Clitoria ternatea]|uniref:Uncharacterized protein n=1 Tax=Clitoria ternatea TaxID=43366 RepID=A0AAN9PUL8_CLITE